MMVYRVTARFGMAGRATSTDYDSQQEALINANLLMIAAAKKGDTLWLLYERVENK